MNRFKIILLGFACLILLGGVIYGAMKLYYGWIVPGVWNIGQLGLPTGFFDRTCTVVNS